jgi:hypothetical protein
MEKGPAERRTKPRAKSDALTWHVQVAEIAFLVGGQGRWEEDGSGTEAHTEDQT